MAETNVSMTVDTDNLLSTAPRSEFLEQLAHGGYVQPKPNRFCTTSAEPDLNGLVGGPTSCAFYTKYGWPMLSKDHLCETDWWPSHIVRLCEHRLWLSKEGSSWPAQVAFTQ